MLNLYVVLIHLDGLGYQIYFEILVFLSPGLTFVMFSLSAETRTQLKPFTQCLLYLLQDTLTAESDPPCPYALTLTPLRR